MPETIRRLLPGCRLTTAGSIDGRTKEAALLRRVRADLTAHVGGGPTASQAVLIERAAVLSLQLARLDISLAAGAPVDEERYLAWSNSLGRVIARLGPPRKPPLPSLAEHLARREREAAARGGAAA